MPLIVKYPCGKSVVRIEQVNMRGRKLSNYVDEMMNTENTRLKWLIGMVSPTFREENYGVFSVFVTDFILEDYQLSEYIFMTHGEEK